MTVIHEGEILVLRYYNIISIADQPIVFVMAMHDSKTKVVLLVD